MTHRLTRGELYDLVWSHPTQRVAKQFGISDVGLAEACRRAKRSQSPATAIGAFIDQDFGAIAL
jgi:hypothetical protein